ncbi:bifunctional diguanylate cyclase/phosphodiesterase [Roseixanthobacter pseudopolyaromaticivorans]|uniref:bifunctional diguanylate cyclase/phosphodiesterase n=1 Tax=Xanthobacteraceae TaxID=335928 RepID=UPI003728B228
MGRSRGLFVALGREANIPRRAGAAARSFSVATIAAVLVVVTCLCAILAFATASNDARSNAFERQTVLAALSDHAALMKRTVSLLEPDEEVSARVKQNDRAWLHENLGVTLNNHFGYERTFLLDRQQRVVYASSLGQEVDQRQFDALRPALQRMMRDPGNRDAEDSGEPLAGFVATSDFVGLAVVRSFRKTDTVGGGPDVLESVTVDLVDDAFLGELAQRVQLAGFRVYQGPPPNDRENYITLTNLVDGSPMVLAWVPERPGVSALQRIAPLVAALSLTLLAICLMLLVQSRRTGAALAASEAEAKSLAMEDYLTGLANRGGFVGRLQARIASLSGNEILAMAYLDLDGFKDINDTLGHGVGDELLCLMASRVRQALGDRGLAARFGGDEFVLYMTCAERSEVETFLTALLTVMQQPVRLEGHELQIGASIGVAFVPEHTTDPGELMRLADIALYRAKADGRGLVRFFVPELEQDIRNRRTVELELAEAIDSGQMALVFQPQVDVESERIVGFEALVRWDHPERGRLPPETFVPIAERSRLICRLDNWVMRRACELGRRLDDVTVSVNMSPISLRQPNIADLILESLAQTGFEPSRLEIEITESAIIQADSEVNAALLRLRESGVRIALDDFGTGHASLVHIRRFPVTKIKIDRSFISNLGTERDAAAIVEYVVRLGRSLGIVLTAEGVETREQLRFLRAFGAQQAQGFLFSGPVSIDAARAMLAAQDSPSGRPRPPGSRRNVEA